MERVNVNVMMFGGRRCGKTSVLAAIKDRFEDGFGEMLNIKSSNIGTAQILADKAQEIKRYFNEYRELGRRTVKPDDSPTEGDSVYGIDVNIKGKEGSKITLNFTDIPGEFIVRPDKEQWMQENMGRSHVIMIVIDTPYLMEKAPDDQDESIGIYNEDRNWCDKVAEFLKGSFSDKRKGSFPTMIMFVPLKCEKYYNAKQMFLVNKKIHTAYKKIFDFVSGENRSLFEVAITPVLTFGPSVEFSRFGTDENGEIKILNGLPEEQIYIFRGGNYAPQYCEQPVCYALAYLLSVAEMAKRNENWIVEFFTELFCDAASLNDWIAQKNTVINKLKIEDDGFEVVSDPLGLRNRK